MINPYKNSIHLELQTHACEYDVLWASPPSVKSQLFSRMPPLTLKGVHDLGSESQNQNQNTTLPNAPSHTSTGDLIGELLGY